MTQIDVATNGGLSATQRVAQFQQQYGWMPLQTAYALVDSGLSDTDIQQAAQHLTRAAVQSDQANAQNRAAGKSVANTGFSFKQFFDDPVLQKAPSAGLALKQYLSGAVGSWPVADQSLAHQQQQLQLRGYGQGLPVDGNWNQAWDAAYQQYGEHLYNTHLAGDSPGTISLKTAMKALSSLQPTSAFDAVVGFIKSIPSDVRDLMADVAGASVQLGHSVLNPGDAGNRQKLAEVRGQTTSDVINFLGGDTSVQAETARVMDPKQLFGSFVRDLSTVYMLTGIMGAGKRLATAIGEESALAGTEAGAKLSADAAMRGPGVIARTLSTQQGTIAGARVSRAALGGVLGAAGVTASGSDNPLEILAGAAGGAVLGGLSTTNVFRNIPVLGNTGPTIGELGGDISGYYYKTRSLLATPYKYAPVRVAGQTFQDVTLLGAKARGLAALQSGPLGTTNAMTQGVQNEHAFSAIDDAIKHRLDFTILGAHIAPSINDLQFFLHGPVHAGTPETRTSDVVAADFNGIIHAYSSALTDPGWSAAISRITGKSQARNIADAGGLANYNEFWGHKIADQAAYWAAERGRMTGLLDSGMTVEEGLSNSQRLEDLATRVSAIRADPEQLSEAIRGLRAQGNGSGIEQFVQRVKREMAINGAGPKASEYDDVATYMDAVRLARTRIVPKLSDTVDEHTLVSGARVPFGQEPAAVDEIARLKGQQGFRIKGMGRNKNVFTDPEEVIAPSGMALPGAEQPSLALTSSKARQVFQNATTDPGQFGIARLDRFTRQDAYRAITELQKEWDGLEARRLAPSRGAGIEAYGPSQPVETITRPLAEEYHAWNAKTNDFLYRELGIDGAQIPESGADKLAAAQDAAKHLAVDIHVHPDAPPEIAQAVTDLRRLGYKPVSGTGIGHIITGTSPVDALEGPLTWQRKLAEHVGLNPNMYPNQTIAHTRTTGIINAINDGVQSGKIQLPPYWDANTVVAALEKDGFIDQMPGRFKGAVMHLFRTPERVAKANNIDLETATAELNHALMPRDIPRKKIVEAFTNPEHFGQHFPDTQAAINANPINHPAEHMFGDFPAMSHTSAEALYRAIVKGSSDVPGYQLGAQRLEELFRSSLGFAGNGTQYRAGLGALAGAGAAYSVDPNDPMSVIAGGAAGATLAALGGDKLGWAMANLPNKLIQLRNEFRFELDPWFSFRRIAKVNVKLAAENVNPTINPLKTMQEAGTLNHDKSVLARVSPELHNAISDDADRYLQSQDVFGLYNHRNYEAYAAGHWARQGLSDGEIKAKLVRTFEYGSGEVAGRSALERSANFVFFPFSFEKTVYRNLGAYLLDRPAQRMLLTRAMSAYDDFNREHGDNPLSTKFLTDHAPILQEAANLNMFAHGLSLGQPGGINRPLLNLFLPQSWSSSKDNLDKLKQFVPAVKNFGRIYTEITQQSGIVKNAGVNMWRDLKGIPATYGNPATSTLTKNAQLTEAFNMQREWFVNYQTVLDHNAKTKDPAQKINFPLSAEWGKYAGEPITKSNIREIIHGYYPEYSPTAAVTIATNNSRAFQQYLLDTKGTPLHDYVQSFATNAHNLAIGMTSNRFSAADVASYTASLRAQAVYIAGQDSAFFRLYSSNFRKILGPLEAVA